MGWQYFYIGLMLTLGVIVVSISMSNYFQVYPPSPLSLSPFNLSLLRVRVRFFLESSCLPPPPLLQATRVPGLARKSYVFMGNVQSFV